MTPAPLEVNAAPHRAGGSVRFLRFGYMLATRSEGPLSALAVQKLDFFFSAWFPYLVPLRWGLSALPPGGIGCLNRSASGAFIGTCSPVSEGSGRRQRVWTRISSLT